MDSETPALIAIEDPALLEEVQRAAATAAVGIDSTLDRHSWKSAPIVVCDRASAARCAADQLPRRTRIVLVTFGPAQLADWQSATVAGAERLLELPAEAADLVALLGDSVCPGPGNGVVLAVLGARGGAGASVLSAALALRAAERRVRPRTLLLDCDRHGGGLDLLMGIESHAGLRWEELLFEDGRIPATALHDALPSAEHGLTVLSTGNGPGQRAPSASAVESVLQSCRTAGDLVVCDLPREQSEQVEAVLETADLSVLLVPADLRSTVAAGRAAEYLRNRCKQAGLVIRGPAPGGLRSTEIATAVRMPLLATMRPQPRLAEKLECGGLRLHRRGPLRNTADRLLAELPSDTGTAT